ncbi:MAG TPA: hypothetical protein VF624_11610 [Tepidisphaeraceae bacterium]
MDVRDPVVNSGGDVSAGAACDAPVAGSVDTALHASIAARRVGIREALLRTSRTIQFPNFLRVADGDLKTLFGLYDAQFFDNALTTLLGGPGRCGLGFSGRLRSSGGVTRRWREAGKGAWAYEIVISSTLLLENFQDGRGCVLCGVHCPDRLDGLMRVFEHELLHLLEFLRYDNSRCAGRRFQALARGYFGHVSHQHRMTTARQRTLAGTTLRPGAAVRFVVDGRALTGVINTIHKRATVLVESGRGRAYSDGRRYEKYYVPLGRLTAV